MKEFSGIISHHISDCICLVSRESIPFYKRSHYAKLSDRVSLGCLGYKACICTKHATRFRSFFPPTVAISDISDIPNDSVVKLSSDGRVSVLWDSSSEQNSLLLTESCNCRCLMCPQPPKKHEPMLLTEAHKILDLLKDKPVNSICLTGGEPTLLKNEYLEILKRCTDEHPDAYVLTLTNGKVFKDRGFVKELSCVSTKNTCFAVSLHSDIASVHDTIVGSKGSYEAAQHGIYNLAEYDLFVEIRHVITKLNYERLLDFSKHMYNYFPCCDHLAYMGMELCGVACENEEAIFISPEQYKNELESASLFLKQVSMPFSIYNVPLCLCGEQSRLFARQSISGWKNIFSDKCEFCSERDNCSGFFSTSKHIPTQYIQPL